MSAHRWVLTGALCIVLATVAACGDGGGTAATNTTASAAGTPTGKGLTLTKEANPGKVVWVDSGGETLTQWKKVLLDPYTAITGTTFDTVSPNDIAQVRAQISAGRTIWDIIGLGPSPVLNNCDLLFEKIDLSLYSNIDRYPPNSVTPCLVPGSKIGVVFSYQSDAYSNAKPSSIKDFFDIKKFPGKRLVYDDPASGGLYEAALVADGVDPNKLYPLDLARAQKKMDSIKSDLVLEPTFSAAQADLATNKMAMALMVSGRMITAEAVGAKYTPVWDFTKYNLGGPAIVKNAPNLANAQKVLAYAATKEVELAYAAASGLYPMNPDIKPDDVQFTAAQRKWNAFEPNRGSVVLADPVWYSNNTNALVQAYNRWKVG